MSPTRPRQRYTAQFRADAVSLVIDSGYSCAEVARRLGINANNVTRWVRQHRDQQEYTDRYELSPKQMQAEIKRLRKENKRLEMEREILKKAAAFFAKESD